MPTQERLLRELVACNGCPKFNKAITAAVGDTDPASLPYEQLLQILQSLPVTEYCGTFEAQCQALLDAMRAGDNPELINSLAAELVNQVPNDWGMTSGTTGSSKYFPMTGPSMERNLKATGRPAAEMQLLKFPLQPYRGPAAATDSSEGSSSTNSSSKDAGGEQQDGWRHRTLSLALAGPCEELPGGHFVGSVSSVFMCKFSKLGVNLDHDMEGRDITTRPVRLMYQMAKPGVEAAPRYYALWLCAAADPGLHRVTFLTDLFAGNMLTALSVLQSHWKDLVSDLQAGKMASQHAAGLPGAAVACVNDYMAAASPDALAVSAQHIQGAMVAYEAGQTAGQAHQPLLGLLMPNLHAVLVVLTGSHSKFWPSLSALIPKDVPVVTPWHAGTEGLYGISKQLVEPGSFDTTLNPVDQQYVIMANGSCFFEFLPVQAVSNSSSSSSRSGATPAAAAAGRGLPVVAAAAAATVCDVEEQQQEQEQQQQQEQPAAVQGQAALTMDDVQVGHHYELVVSSFVGLTRYRVGDVVRVDSFMAFDTSTCLAAQPGADPTHVLQLPIVTFQGRVGVVLNLVWEKYDERQLLQAIQDTVHTLMSQQQQDKQQAAAAFPGLADFTVYEDHGDESRKHYAFFWELAAPPPAPTQTPPAAALLPEAADGTTKPWSAVDVAGWAAELDVNLGKQNAVYAGLLAARQVAAARVQLVSPGSFQALQEAFVEAKGISPSQYKLPMVVAPDSQYVKFLRECVIV